MGITRTQQIPERTLICYQPLPRTEASDKGEYADGWSMHFPGNPRRYQRLADIQILPGHRGYVDLAHERYTIQPRRTVPQIGVPATKAMVPRASTREKNRWGKHLHRSHRARQGHQWHFPWFFFTGTTVLAGVLGWIALSIAGHW